MPNRSINGSYIPRLVKVASPQGSIMSMAMIEFSKPEANAARRKYFSDEEVILAMQRVGKRVTAEKLAEQLDADLTRIQKRLRQYIQAGAASPKAVGSRAGATIEYRLNSAVAVVDMANARAAAQLIPGRGGSPDRQVGFGDIATLLGKPEGITDRATK
jgi:hypothetical protein